MDREFIIRELRKRQGGRSLRQFAKHLGISAPYLSDIYLGKRDPGPAILSQMKLVKIVTRSVVYRRKLMAEAHARSRK